MTKRHASVLGQLNWFYCQSYCLILKVIEEQGGGHGGGHGGGYGGGGGHDEQQVIKIVRVSGM